MTTVGAVQAQTEIIEKYNQAIAAPTDQKIALLQEVIASAPNFLEARYALGATYYELENFKAAAIHFEYILERPDEVAKKPTIASIVAKSNLQDLVAAAYNAIGSQFLEASTPDSAVIVLERAIALDRSKPIFHYNLGIAYLKQERYRQALESLRESLKQNQDNPLAWFNLGTAYWYLDDFESAIEAYRKGLEIDPNNESALSNLKKAQDKIRQEALFSLVDSSIAAQNPAHAITLLREIKTLDPSNAIADSKLRDANLYATYMEAREHYDRGRWQEAQRSLDALPSGYRDSNVLLASIRQKLDSEQIQRQLEQEFRAARSLFDSGNFAAARQKADAILREKPDFPGLKSLSASIDSAIEANTSPERVQPQNTTQNTTAGQSDANEIERSANTPPAEEPILSAKPNQSGSDSGSTNSALKAPAESRTPTQTSPNTQNDASAQTIILIIVSAGVLLFAIVLLAKRRRSRKATASNISSGEQANEEDESVFVKAAVEKVDFTELDREKASSSDASHQRFFEDLVDDQVIANDPLSESGTVEIHELADDKSKKAEADAAKSHDDDLSETAEDHADGDTFLSILQSENLVGDKKERDSGADSGSINATHTVDMSQFKTRKIGRYLIEKEIGRGAAGRIYKAWDPKLDRTVVIKTVSYSLTASDDEIRRLKARVYREARAAAKLNHPNIVVVYDVEDEPTFSYIVMEHIEGMDMRELLLKETKISPERTFYILMQVCKALQFSHSAGIIHRDIKPSNILIVTKDKVKVTDFGIAKVSNHLTLTQTGRVVGTPSYMAPEQIEGADVDGRADIFSLGVVLYELLTGQRPFAGESLAALAYKIVHVEPTPPSLVNLELPDVCDSMVSRAIAKDPSDRYQTINDFLKDLQSAQSQLASTK